MVELVRLGRAITAPPVTYHPYRHPAVNFYTWNGVTVETRRKHESVLSRFLAYRGQYTACPLPATQSLRLADEVLEWLAVSAEFVQAGTVQSWMTSLRAAFMDLNIDAAFFDSRHFLMFRRGIRRVKGESAPRTALPITLPILSLINHTVLARVDISATQRLLLATAYAVAFACFMRIGELTYTEFDPLVHLQRKDVLFTPQGMCIHLKGSKTDVGRRGVNLPLPSVQNPAYRHVCPSTLLRMLLDTTPGSLEDPLFRFERPHGTFEAKTLIRECRQALIVNGFSVSDIEGRTFSGHSFRRGAATWGARVGLDDRTIMLLGRWSIKSLPGGHQRYIEVTLEDRRARLSTLYNGTPLWDVGGPGFDLDEDEMMHREGEQAHRDH